MMNLNISGANSVTPDLGVRTKIGGSKYEAQQDISFGGPHSEAEFDVWASQIIDPFIADLGKLSSEALVQLSQDLLTGQEHIFVNVELSERNDYGFNTLALCRFSGDSGRDDASYRVTDMKHMMPAWKDGFYSAQRYEGPAGSINSDEILDTLREYMFARLEEAVQWSLETTGSEPSANYIQGSLGLGGDVIPARVPGPGLPYKTIAKEQNIEFDDVLTIDTPPKDIRLGFNDIQYWVAETEQSPNSTPVFTVAQLKAIRNSFVRRLDNAQMADDYEHVIEGVDTLIENQHRSALLAALDAANFPPLLPIQARRVFGFIKALEKRQRPSFGQTLGMARLVERLKRNHPAAYAKFDMAAMEAVVYFIEETA